MYIPASFNIKDKKKKNKILSSNSEEEPEKIESLRTIHDIPSYSEVDPATFELLAKMDSEYYESPSSESETDELHCNISSCSECDECHTLESSSDDKLHFQIPKWKNKKEWRSLPEFYSSRESKPPREFKGDTIYTWSIYSKTTQEIIDMCGDMLTCYRCYLASGLDSILAYKMITSGFTGSLQQWMYAVEKQTPGTLSTWEQMILLHTSGPQTGQLVLDEQGKEIINALGCMVHYLQNAFIGNEKPEPGVLELWLQKMKCRDLTQFEEYYNQYIAIVFRLPDPLNEKWTNLFLNSLPSWFVQRLNRIWPPVNGQSGFKGQPFGLIRQAVHAEILDTCKEIKFQKDVQDPMKSGTYRALCKQRNLPPPAFDEKIQRSSHSSKHSSSKKTSKRGGKYHKYHGKYHKSHQKHHDKTKKTRK